MSVPGVAVRQSRRGGLPWRANWRQSRRDLAALIVGMIVIASATCGAAIVPQLLDSVATATVRAAVSDPAHPANIVVSVPIDLGVGSDIAANAAYVRGQVEAGMPAQIRGVLGAPITSLTGPELKAGSIAGRPGRVRFIYLASDTGPGLTWVDGRAPGASVDQPGVWDGETLPPVEVGLAEAAAQLMGVQVGQRIGVQGASGTPLDVWLTGIYRPADAADPAWAVEPTLITPQLVDGSAAVASVGLLVTAASVPAAEMAGYPPDMTQNFTYPVLADRLTAQNAAELETQVRGLASGRKTFDLAGSTPTVNTRLDRFLHNAMAMVAAASAQASVLLIGLLATAMLVELLIAAVIVERRTPVLRQLRSRGATLPAIMAANLAESAALSLVAGVIGVVVSWLVTRGLPPLAWVLPPVIAAVLPQPILAVRAARGPAVPASLPAGRRRARTAAQLRRLGTEIGLVVLAAAALATLVVRGAVSSADSVWSDAVVLAAPVLVAVAVALGLIRLQPRVAALARALAARRRGVVPLLAASRVRRGAVAMTALVVAAAVAAISANAAATVAQGRIGASWDAVGADASALTTATAGMPAAVTALDGTDGLNVATAVTISNAQLLGSGVDRSVTVLAVDSPAMARLLAATPSGPVAALSGLSAAGADGVAVLVSGVPELASANLRWGDESVPVRSVGDAAGLPVRLALDDGPTVVVDRQALGVALGRDVPASWAWAVGPNAGDRLSVALQGLDARIVTRTGWLDAQASAPLPDALDRLFVGAWAVAAMLAALAVMLLAASGAGERTRAGAQLRVLGTSRADAARISGLETTVPVVLASLVGLAVGVGLSALLVGALELRSVTGGRAAPALVVDWWVFVLPVVLGVVARLAVVVADLSGRRMPLGPLMRLS